MEKLNEILRSYVPKNQGDKTSKDELLGAAFVVVNKNGVIYEGAAGGITPAADAPKFAVTSQTWTASMTKLFTAVCAMQLVEKGSIGLDDDVRPLVPQLAEAKILRGFVGADIPFLEANTAPITLRLLLTHTAGFGYGNSDPDLIRWAKHVGRRQEDVAGTVAAWDLPLKFPPGQGWYYGTGIDWAGQVVERLTGQTLGQYMAAHVFAPLGLRDSTFRGRPLAHVGPERVVPTAYRDAATGELGPGPELFPSAHRVDSGGAGLCTTAADYAKVLQSLLRSLAGDGPGNGNGTVLAKATVEEMFTPQLSGPQRQWFQFITDLFHHGMVADFAPGLPLDHGISGVINLEDSAGKRKRGSMMWAGVCNSHWFVDPTSGIGACFFTNISPQPDAVVSKIWDELERAVYSHLLPSLSARPTGREVHASI